MRTVTRRLMPVAGSNSERRASPLSMTTRTPSMVRLVSAMLVARITLRLPRGAASSTCCWAPTSSSPYSAWTTDTAWQCAVLQQPAQPVDLRRARQEHQHVAVGLLQHAPHLRQPCASSAQRRDPAHRAGSAGPAPDSAVSRIQARPSLRSPAHRRACGPLLRCRALPTSPAAAAPARCRVRASQREREPQVGMQAALVEFVEQHGRHVFERGVFLQHPREDALGDDLESRRGSNARVESHAVAHGLADALAERAAPCVRPRRAPRVAAVPAAGSACRAPRAHRAAPAARRCSCPRRAAPRARPVAVRAARGVSAGSASRPAAAVRWRVGGMGGP